MFILVITLWGTLSGYGDPQSSNSLTERRAKTESVAKFNSFLREGKHYKHQLICPIAQLLLKGLRITVLLNLVIAGNKTVEPGGNIFEFLSVCCCYCKVCFHDCALFFCQWLACLSLCEKTLKLVMPGLLIAPWSRISVLSILSILVLLNQLKLPFCV